METREILLRHLDETISKVLGVYRSMSNPEIPVYEEWTAKDILGHITFWHESFARNASDIVNDIKPRPVRGNYHDINRRCMADMRAQAVGEILKRLEAAHRVIQANILSAKLTVIPYRIGSRDYSPEEHLAGVNKHIQGHLKAVIKSIQD